MPKEFASNYDDNLRNLPNGYWTYLYASEFKTPYVFKLTRCGFTNGQYPAFCLDGSPKESNGIYRIAIRKDYYLADLIARNIEWRKLINKNIRIDKIENCYIFFQLSEDRNYFISILGFFYYDSNRWTNSPAKELPKEISSITISGTTKDNCLLCFCNKDGKEICYYNPQRNTENISANDEECKKLRDISYKSPTETINDEDLAKIFLRSTVEIQNLRKILSKRSELRAGSQDLNRYLNYKDYFAEHPNVCVIIGAITNSEYASGQIIKVGQNMSEVLNTEHAKSIFNMLCENDVLPADEISLTFQSPGDDTKIFSNEPDDKIKESLWKSKFLNDFPKYFAPNSELTCNIAFEDIFYGARKFNSYYFVISDNSEAVKNVWENNRYYLIRYLLFLRSENENYANEQKRRQAIKSAISAIMSRNMSHNLGSHFLHYTKMDLQRYSLGLDINACISGASHSFGFLQDRMNYLAAIVDADKYPNMPVNYYSSLYKGICVDEFQIDKNSSPTNYYLRNLIRSEGYSKSDETLTISHTQDEKSLNNLQLSFPGGLVSAHAFYNILENFIRNSAKYQWGTKKPEKMKFRISIGKKDDYAIFTIWDNKQNALKENKEGISLVEFMNSRLSGMKILDENGEIDRRDKGLKEMLISALWLQINRTSKTLGDILYEFDASSKKEKEKLLSDYGIQYGSLKIDESLGFRFRIPLHHSVAPFEDQKDQYGPHADILLLSHDSSYFKNYARVIPEEFIKGPQNKISNNFKPRVHERQFDDNGKDLKHDFLNAFYLHLSMKSNGIDSNKYYLHIIPDERNEYREDDIDNGKKILYTHHLSTSANITPEDIRHYYYNDVYADSISGKNYTKLLCDQYISSLVSYDYTQFPHKWKDMYRMLLIKESALTKITIIDERLFDGIERWLDINTFEGFIERSQLELDLKNIRVLNYFESDTDMKEHVSVAYKEKILKKTGVIWSENEAFELPFYGNEYRKVLGEDSNSSCHFLSIHLGIIEKMLNNSQIIENDKLCGPKGDNALSKERVYRFMELLKEAFHPKYMCIHSGRGNLNKEMKEILDKYTLVPFSSLQAMFYDSKFMLSQLFYNIKY